ncbi:MAG: hypothetical protein ACRETA_09465 [Gammaproteobacteria bacterium]
MVDKTSKRDSILAVDMALDAAADNSKTSERTAEYLEQHIALAKAQLEQLDIESERNQREAALHDLRAENLKLHNHALLVQHAQLRSQQRHERLRMVYQAVLSAFVVALLGLCVYAIYTAATDHSVVVNQFQVPPSFIAAGENGTVVASEFLDQLQSLKASALSSPDARSLQGAWVNNIQLQIPEMHVSLGDLRRTLHGWLGHQIEINGEVVLQGKNIALTVRGTGIAAQTFHGAPTDLKSMLGDAAEYVYVQAEP